MKIRWNSASIRLRITPTELKALTLGNSIEEQLSVGAAWKITVQPVVKEPTSLAFEGPAARIRLSQADVHCLAAPDKEGVYFQNASADRFRYFIEKDFPCAHPRPADALEPMTETFLAPDGFEQRKNAA